MLSYNKAVHSATKFSPFELVFGNKPKLPSSITQPPEFKYTYETYLDQLKYKLNKSQEISRNNIIKQKHKSKEYYNKNAENIKYKIGDLVYLRNEAKTPNRSKKLTQNYNGPYKVVKILSRSNVMKKLKTKNVIVHINRLKPAFVSDS